MLVSMAILFGTISVFISTVLVFSAIVVATKAGDSMKNLPPQPQPELEYDSRFGKYEAAPTLVAIS